RAPDEIVGEIEDAAVAAPVLGLLPLQPHQLGDFHLQRHDATDMLEHAMLGRRRFICLGSSAVIEPDDDVPLVVAGDRYAGGPAVCVKGDQRTGGVEAHAGNIGGSYSCLGARRPHAAAHCLPNIIARMLGMVGSGTFEADGMTRASQPM